jgi:hypothetical protein
MCGYVSPSLYRAVKAANQTRREARCGFVVVTLKKDGTTSKAHDATERFAAESEARDYVARVRSLNPTRQLRFALNGSEI